eukprot:818510-Karenia_brevis.AAC.1
MSSNDENGRKYQGDQPSCTLLSGETKWEEGVPIHLITIARSYPVSKQLKLGAEEMQAIAHEFGSRVDAMQNSSNYLKQPMIEVRVKLASTDMSLPNFFKQKGKGKGKGQS